MTLNQNIYIHKSLPPPLATYWFSQSAITLKHFLCSPSTAKQSIFSQFALITLANKRMSALWFVFGTALRQYYFSCYTSTCFEKILLCILLRKKRPLVLWNPAASAALLFPEPLCFFLLHEIKTITVLLFIPVLSLLPSELVCAARRRYSYSNMMFWRSNLFHKFIVWHVPS